MTNVLKKNVYTADFETTTEANLRQDGKVSVWCWSLVNADTEDAFVGRTIPEFLEEIVRLKAKIVFFP